MALTADQKAWAKSLIGEERSVVVDGTITGFEAHPTQEGTVLFIVAGGNGQAQFAQIPPESDRDRARREAKEQAAAEAALAEVQAAEAEAARQREEAELANLHALQEQIEMSVTDRVQAEVARVMNEQSKK